MIDFPTLEEESVAAQAPAAQALAPVPKPDLDLAKVSLRDVALAQFGLWREEADGVVKQLTGLVLDLGTPSKIAEAKSLRQRLINVPLAEARKVSKAIKSKLTAVSADVGEELVLIEKAYAGADALITPLIEAADKKLAEEKAERDRIEAERVAAIQASIDKIRACVAKCQAPDMTSTRIGAGIAQVESIAITKEVFFELTDEAAQAKSSTLAAMLNLRDSAKAREDQEALRLENERIAAELQREREHLAEQQRALEAQQAELKAQQQAAEDARIAAEQKEREAAEARAAAALADEEANRRQREEARNTPAQEPQQVLKAEPATADATDRGTPVTTSPDGGPMGAEKPAAAGLTSDHTTNTQSGLMPETSGPCASSEAEPAQASPSGSGMAVQAEEGTARSVAPSDNVRAFHPAAAALRGDAPTIQIGYINELIAPVLTTSTLGLTSLGFERQNRPGPGVHFLEAEQIEIITALRDHLDGVLRSLEAVAAA